MTVAPATGYALDRAGNGDLHGVANLDVSRQGDLFADGAAGLAGGVLALLKGEYSLSGNNIVAGDTVNFVSTTNAGKTYTITFAASESRSRRRPDRFHRW